MTLTEKYAKRIKIAESVYSGSHQGQVMDSNRKLMVATALNNVNKFLFINRLSLFKQRV